MGENSKILIGCEKTEVSLKNELLRILQKEGYTADDFAEGNAQTEYYMDAVEGVCRAVQSGKYDRGILIGSKAQSMNIAANKFTGIRSALCINNILAQMAREDDDTNILCIGSWLMDKEKIPEMTKVWLDTEYFGANGGCQTRIAEFEKTRKKQ